MSRENALVGFCELVTNPDILGEGESQLRYYLNQIGLWASL